MIKMNFTEIKYRQEDGIAWITLNRPDKMNALTPVMMSEWVDALKLAEADEACRIVVVKGAGRAWSAGVDLTVFEDIKIIPGYKMYDDGMEVMRLLQTMPQVSIAMVNGFCFTGALEIMLAFDLAIAADEAKMGDTHAKWGIPPKWGMSQRLMHQVGLRQAKMMTFTAKSIKGPEAVQLGLVNESVPLADLETRVLALATQIMGNSAQTIAAIKDLYEYGSTHTLEEGLEYERNKEVVLTDKADNLKNFKKEI